MDLQEIEAAFSRFGVCPRCNSRGGFWLGLKRDHAYVQCKGCGAKFELFEAYSMGEKGKPPEKLKFLRK